MAFQSLTPNLMVSDVRLSAAFYCDLLGMTCAASVDGNRGFHEGLPPEGVEPVWSQFLAGKVELMVQTRESLEADVPSFAFLPLGASMTLYFGVDDLDALHARLKDAVSTVKGPETAFYGMREWYLTDPDGYVVCLAQKQ